MHVTRLRRGWRMRLTDNEMALLRETVNLGLSVMRPEDIDGLPYKLKKVLYSSKRWAVDPLTPDEDRRVA